MMWCQMVRNVYTFDIYTHMTSIYMYIYVICIYMSNVIYTHMTSVYIYTYDIYIYVYISYMYIYIHMSDGKERIYI